MNSVLISIKPNWCELIASGEKMVEVRKTKPKIDVPFKCYIYETKDKKFEHIGVHYADGRKDFIHHIGKVIGEFVCDQIDVIGYSPEMHGKYISDIDDIHYVSCVDFEQMFDYLADGYGYGWHITDLVIYDEPRELSDFHIVGCKGCRDKDTYHCKFHCRGERRLKRPPQSWCYAERL